MTVAAFPRRNKYHVGSKGARTDTDGTVFHSVGELRRWKELQLMQRAGEIHSLRRQVSFPLFCGAFPVLIRSGRYKNGKQAMYTADFAYRITATGAEILEDFKGITTTEAKLRIAIFEASYQRQVVISGRSRL
jgi:Protein of unknown function (DUF1064)